MFGFQFMNVVNVKQNLFKTYIMKTGIELIAQERKEQLKKHKWTSEHDDQHDCGELTDAAIVCASEDLLYYFF